MMMLVVILLLDILCPAHTYCPQGCGCDNTLLSVSCIKTDMEVMPISLNPSINSLILKYNKFTTVDASISFYPRLQLLDVSSNRIEKLPDKIFLSQQNLLNLQISRNNISVISPLVFCGLKQLQVLNISGNPIKHLENRSFSELAKLHHLDLSGLGLTSLYNETFAGLTSIKRLNLNGNLIKHISSSWTVHLSSLETLEISNNQIHHINSTIRIPGLINLDLSNNNLSSISSTAFLELKQLRFLNLESNSLHIFPSRVFPPLLRLEHIDLSENQFEVVPSEAFKMNADLKILEISRCPNLAQVETGAFSSNTRLENVTISGNPVLEEIAESSFSIEMESLVHLDISDNLLRFIHPNMTPWVGLVNLQIAGNPWHCDCSALIIRMLIEDQIVRGGSPMRRTTCLQPDLYRGWDILTLPDTVCTDSKIGRQLYDHRRDMVLYMSTVIFTSLIIMIVVLIFTFLGFNCIRRSLRSTKHRSTSSSGTEDSYYQVHDPLQSPTTTSKKPLSTPDSYTNELQGLMEPEIPGGIMYFYRDQTNYNLHRSTEQIFQRGRPDHHLHHTRLDHAPHHGMLDHMHHRTLHHGLSLGDGTQHRGIKPISLLSVNT